MVRRRATPSCSPMRLRALRAVPELRRDRRACAAGTLVDSCGAMGTGRHPRLSSASSFESSGALMPAWTAGEFPVGCFGSRGCRWTITVKHAGPPYARHGTRRSVVLESRSCLDARSQAFVGAVVLGWVEIEAWHRVQRSQAIGVLGERALPAFGADLAGHVGDERGQHVEAAVPEQAVVDRPQDVEQRAVDAVRLIGVGGSAGR